MRIDILTVLPELLAGPFSASIVHRAQQKGLCEIHIHNIREYGLGKRRDVDDYQYGGGAGMVMMCEPIATLIEKLKSERTYDEIIYMTPDGEVLDQAISNQMSMFENILILCGHYKGVDERIRELYITREISIGSYVLSGGELAAAVLADSIVRLIPGVLTDETSALSDSFQDNLLSPPVYTRPPEFNGLRVPDVLLSGDFKKIEKYREEKALERTKQRRPDLLDNGNDN
ncbi:MAG TPA: tRNA (guanosine(37)-N1)-methyltransferase TrmD [Crocinitomicaceae bacterium]|nr:tRNA (guanosine(37)-N1)-methyltransferase TrmD [Crocinitomicaceae bacterium]